MKIFKLKYGTSYKEISLEENIDVSILDKKFDSYMDEENIIKKALQNPIGSRRVDELITSEDKICIIVSDVTRLWQKQNIFLPILVGEIKKSGIKDENIIFICALGSHRSSTKEEHKSILGEELYRRFKIVDHNCMDNDNMKYLGTTSYNTPVIVNNLLMDFSKIIITGGITFHDMAGFGGGRKSILPGASSYKTIMANHSLVLSSSKRGIDENCNCGNLIGNPIHMDMMEACSMVQPSFLFNVITDSNGKISAAVAGNFEKAFEKGCEIVKENYGVEINDLADEIIISAGGYPKDIDLYQASKALSNAKEAVKKGGKIVLFAKCVEGIGNKEMKEIINNFENNLEREDELRRSFTIAKFTAYLICKIAEEYNVILISDICSETVNKANINVIKDNEEISALFKNKNTQKIYIMPNGSNILPIKK
ncbi:MAG: hypothetical protein K0R54_1104 [Clostridiaceae bacterium]|nr:hypothetical protein [Clostridiaceae bacterium]